MTFPEWAGNWGPAIPIFVVLAWFLQKLVNKVIPRGFREIRRAMMTIENGAKERHTQHLDNQKILIAKMEEVAEQCGKCRSSRRTKKRTPTKR